MSFGRTTGMWLGSGKGPEGSLMVALVPCARATSTRTAAPRPRAIAVLKIVTFVKRITGLLMRADYDSRRWRVNLDQLGVGATLPTLAPLASRSARSFDARVLR